MRRSGLSPAESFLAACGRVRTYAFTLMLRRSFAEFGAGSRIVPPLRSYGLRGIQVGERVLVNSHCWIQTLNRASSKPQLIFGDRCSIGMSATISACNRVEFGDSVLLARNVYVSDHGHKFDDIHTPIVQQGLTESQPVSIGSGSWLGQNVVVLPGTEIGRNCIIGANSVVKGIIPDYSVAVGAPARVVRRYRPETDSWSSLKNNHGA